MHTFFTQCVALSIRIDGTYTPFSSDAFAFAGATTLLGMGMIFSVLALLWGVLAIFKIVFKEKTPKKQKAAEQTAEVPTAPVTAPVETADTEDDALLVAILTAAVAAYRTSEEGPFGQICCFAEFWHPFWRSFFTASWSLIVCAATAI